MTLPHKQQSTIPIRKAIGLLSVFCTLMLCSLITGAADIAREVRQGDTGTGESEGFSGSGELRFTIATQRLPLIGFNSNQGVETRDANQSLNIGLHGILEWRGLFAEALHEDFSELTLGYHLWENQDATLDLVFSSQQDYYAPGDVTGYETVTDRENDFNAGFRSSYSRGNYIMQFELMTSISSTHDGVIGAWQIGRQWQKRNWNMHALAGFRYFSSGVLDYYYGIDSAEVSEATPLYEAGSGALLTAEIGATVPINEKWLFNTNASFMRLPDSVVESPLAQGRSAYNLQLGFSRVF